MIMKKGSVRYFRIPQETKVRQDVDLHNEILLFSYKYLCNNKIAGHAHKCVITKDGKLSCQLRQTLVRY